MSSKLNEGPNRYYTVRYDPEDNTVCKVALNILLADIFHQEKANAIPARDFLLRVDRTWMKVHDTEFVGLDYQFALNSNKKKNQIQGRIESYQSRIVEPDLPDGRLL